MGHMVRAGRRLSAVTLLLCPLLHITLAANVVAPARPSDVEPCFCPDPLEGEAVCYEPVCPAGYFRCCSTCSHSSCFDSDDLMISWRGIPECIKCKAGDFCNGCDTFMKCPPITRPGREGPRISKPGTARMADCESCAVGYEAWVDDMQCAPLYSHISEECGGKPCCNKEFLQRCMRNCESPDITRRKQLNDCEEIKCIMYCSKLWSDDCVKRTREHCLYVTTPTSDLPGGFFDETAKFVPECDVDCNGAHRPKLMRVVTTVVSVVMGLTLMFGGA